MSTSATPTPGVPAAPTPQKGSGSKVLFWILGIVLGLIVLSLGTCAVVGYFAVHKMKQAGLDSDLMKKNPGYAGAKMMVTMNPKLEIVSSDDDAGTIVVREKDTGKVVTMKFDPQKKQMVITDEKGETTTMTTAEGSNGSFEVKNSQGTVKVGAGSEKAPDWVPSYPGASPQNTFSASNANEQSGSFTYATSDAAEKVIAFYGDSLKSGGFAVSNMTSNSEGKTGGMVSGEDKAKKRTVVVTLSTEDDGTHVNVAYSIKQ